jgi:AraC-like DNA-binding protein
LDVPVVLLSNDCGWRSSLAALLRSLDGVNVVASAGRWVPPELEPHVVIADVIGRTGPVPSNPSSLPIPARRMLLWADDTAAYKGCVVFRERRSIGRLVAHIAAELKSDRGSRRALRPQCIEAIQTVADHYPTITVDGIAASVCISPRHLGRVFGEDTGMSPHTYLARVKVEAAKTQLRESSAKLARIARQVGFYDASHLTRVFRQLEGISPGAFRTRVAP